MASQDSECGRSECYTGRTLLTSLRPQFANTVSNLGDVDSKLFIIVGDISHGLLADFRNKHPNRYRNIGICEQAMLGVAAGLNYMGFNPVIHTISPFLIERTFEQIKLDFGYQKLDCNLVSVGSSFDYSKLGCSHHSYVDTALIASLEESQVFLPGSKEEFDSVFRENYRIPGVKYFRLTENAHGYDFLTQNMKSGEGRVVRQGDDVTIVALGPSLDTAMDVSEKFSEKGINAEVVYVNSIKPFDFKSVRESVLKTRKLITISEISSIGGIRDLCLQSVSGKFEFSFLDFSVNQFVRGYGSYEDLKSRAGISSQRVYENSIQEWFEKEE